LSRKQSRKLEKFPKFSEKFLRTSSASKNKRQKEQVSPPFSEAQADRTPVSVVISYPRWVEKILFSTETSSCV